MKKIIYIAGPIRSKTFFGYLLNVFRAWKAAVRLWRLGWAVVCPHMNSLFMCRRGMPEGLFLEGDLDILRNCDAIVMLKGWENSVGAEGELEEAQLFKLRIYYQLGAKREIG